MCLVTWQITESWTAAYLYAAVFVLNQYEVSRATFALPLRENFALPLWWIRQLSVTLFLKRSYHFSTPGSQKVKILVSLWTSTALFCMFWQFSPFALLLEAMAMTVLHQMSLITDAQCFTLSAIGLLALVCAFASQAGNIFPLASPCAAVLLTNLIWITTKRCYVARYRHSEKPNNEGVLENANPRCGGKCGIICVALCRTLFMALLYSVIMFAFPNEDATHIRLYVREKLNIFPKWNFHTALYLCNEAFRGMDVLDFINGSIAGFGWNVLFYFLGMTALLPWKKLKLCHALRRRLSRLFHIQKQMKDTMSEQQLNKKIKTERGMTICRTWCAAMNITFGVLAWNMLRMKYLWTPHLLFVLTYGVYIFIWSGTQLLLSFIDIVLNKFWKRTVSKTAAIQMKKSQGSSNTKPTGPANTEKMRFWRRLIVGIGLFALANASVFQAYKRLTGRLESLREFYDPDTVELMQWIKNNTDKNALFAGSMQLMAGVKLCSDRPIANHPHYENRRLRERTVQWPDLCLTNRSLILTGRIHKAYTLDKQTLDSLHKPPRKSARFCATLIELFTGRVPVYERERKIALSKYFKLVFNNPTFKVFKVNQF
ncbi:unnamed protein product [Calicophoron daubneyi]|uniref:Uncharacterized protein n=1 Tax=Calicophoron daubneyi TaxID=300641 RepID=A0AAV2TZ26_CALDB